MDKEHIISLIEIQRGGKVEVLVKLISHQTRESSQPLVASRGTVAHTKCWPQYAQLRNLAISCPQNGQLGLSSDITSDLSLCRRSSPGNSFDSCLAIASGISAERFSSDSPVRPVIYGS
jgi:hypothetical protein